MEFTYDINAFVIFQMYMFKSFLKPWYGILFEHQEFLMQGLDKIVSFRHYRFA